MYDINSISELVGELGGPLELGEQLGISQEAVSNWSVRSAIAGGWHIVLAAMIHRKGKTINPRVFNLTEKDVEGLFPAKRPAGRKPQSAVA
jgi:hypothetical protein